MDVKVDFKWEKRKVWLLCSKELHCLIDIIGRYLTGELNIEIPYVISNSLVWKEYVEKFWIPFYYVETKKDSFEHEKEVLKIIKDNPTDLIALARYMKILSQDFIEKVNQKIINVHHSFLPSFIWAKPYDEAYERWVKLIWATSHYVIPELDRWPIIEQAVKRIKHSYDIDNLKIIWRECEKEVFSIAIRKHIENKLIIYKNRTIIFE
jgi:formyltetrahydrofolate deformylase